MEKKTRRRQGGARQLALTEGAQDVPHWTMLPAATQREVIELLVMLLGDDAIALEEADDE